MANDTCWGIQIQSSVYAKRMKYIAFAEASKFFLRGKQYVALGKYQSQDFDAQITDITMDMIEYNVFNLAKRVEAYDIPSASCSVTRN